MFIIAFGMIVWGSVFFYRASEKFFHDSKEMEEDFEIKEKINGEE